MNGATITRVSAEAARQIKDQTDWDRLRREQAAGVEPEDDEDEFELDWAQAEVVLAPAKKLVSIRLDPDVIDFFKSQGKGYQTRINAVLRAYMKARKGL